MDWEGCPSIERRLWTRDKDWWSCWKIMPQTQGRTPLPTFDLLVSTHPPPQKKKPTQPTNLKYMLFSPLTQSRNATQNISFHKGLHAAYRDTPTTQACVLHNVIWVRRSYNFRTFVINSSSLNFTSSFFVPLQNWFQHFPLLLQWSFLYHLILIDIHILWIK